MRSNSSMTTIGFSECISAASMRTEIASAVVFISFDRSFAELSSEITAFKNLKLASIELFNVLF